MFPLILDDVNLGRGGFMYGHPQLHFLSLQLPEVNSSLKILTVKLQPTFLSFKSRTLVYG